MFLPWNSLARREHVHAYTRTREVSKQAFGKVRELIAPPQGELFSERIVNSCTRVHVYNMNTCTRRQAFGKIKEHNNLLPPREGGCWVTVLVKNTCTCEHVSMQTGLRQMKVQVIGQLVVRVLQAPPLPKEGSLLVNWHRPCEHEFMWTHVQLIVNTGGMVQQANAK